MYAHPRLELFFLILLVALAPAMGHAATQSAFVPGTVLAGHEGVVRRVAFLDGPQRRLLSIGHQDRSLNLWQPVSGELIASTEFGFRPHDLSVSPDGRRVDVLLITGEIVSVEIGETTLRKVTRVQDQVGDYGRLATSPDGAFHAVASRSEDVTLWDTRTRRRHQSYLGTTDYRAVEFLEEGVFVAADAEYAITTWDVQANEGFGARARFELPGEARGAVAQDTRFDAATSRLAITHLDGRLSLLRRTSDLGFAHERTLALPRTVFEPVFVAGGTRLLVTCLDGAVHEFEAATGRRLGNHQGDPAGLFSLAVNDREDLMAAGTLDGRIVVWWVGR